MRNHLPLLCIIISLTSCSQIPGKLKTIEGAFFHARQRYHEAAASFLEASSYDETAPYAQYGLGATYLAMGEGRAALGRFASADALATADAAAEVEENRELLYRIHYNMGVIQFEQGDYTAAAGEFRKALESDGGHKAAKRNLELSLLSQDQQEKERSSAGVDEETGGESEILFDYLRQKEQDRWKSREWAEEAPLSGPDY
jgi:Ca-activated chloride channel family protein